MIDKDDGADVTPLVELTEAARQLVLQYRSQSDKPNPDRLAMWIEINGVSGHGFSYDMYLKSIDGVSSDDVVVIVTEDLRVVVPAGSVEQMRGSTIDL